MPEDVFEKLMITKEAIYCAAESIKVKAQAARMPSSVEEHIYWALLFWRGDRASISSLVAKAVHADPALARWKLSGFMEWQPSRHISGSFLSPCR